MKYHHNGSLDECKVRLCTHGRQEQYGIRYWDVFAPIFSWMSVTTLLVFSNIHRLLTKFIYFSQAYIYSQMDIKATICIHTHQGIIF